MKVEKNRTLLKKLLTLFFAIGLLTSLSTSAWADSPNTPKLGPNGQALTLENDWYFGCYPEKETSISAFPPPNILIMLDTSGSMRATDGTGENRLRRAQNAIYSLLTANKEADPRIAFFGFGEYHDYGATLLNTCTPNNDDLIRQSVSDQHYGGLTPTSEAVSTSTTTSCHTSLRPGQSSATAIITDGTPNNRARTIEETCKHRRVAPLYSIGLGPGTDKYFNDMMAAAGGTGMCSKGGREWDPCDDLTLIKQDINSYSRRDAERVRRFMEVYNITCDGSYSANRTNELVAAIRNIISKVSCNFPLEAVGLDLSQLPEDPNNKYPWIKVKVHQSSGSDKNISYIDDNSAEKGWTWKFVNSEKNAVTLGPAACAAIKHRQITSVKTTVGCICKYGDGEQCGGKSIGGVEVCPPGRYTCDRGLNECVANTQSKATTLACQTALTGICSFGHYECVNGTAQCLPNNRPMPELCDGVDNDCDGDEDNIDTSWKKPAFVAEVKKVEALQTPAQRGDFGDPSTYKDYRLRACDGKNLCVCPTLEAKKVEVPMSSADLNEQYSSYVKYWERQRGDCHCQAI